MAVKMLPTSTIKARLGIEPNGRVQKFLANSCKKHMEKYVPYREGNLRRVVTTTASSVTYEMPYAHYQYQGILYVDPDTKSSYAKKDAIKIPTSTPLKYHGGGGSHWDKKMVSAEIGDVVKEVQQYIGGKS